VVYAQSTSAVISGRFRQKKKKKKLATLRIVGFKYIVENRNKHNVMEREMENPELSIKGSFF